MNDLDLLVLGGGVCGLGIARLAARSGWRVALLERADLAAGASSATSHMLHGGLRYLEHGQFALVREALAERAAVSRMAPALARPVRFLVPVWRRGRVPGWKLRAGLALYDLLAGRANLSRHGMTGAAGARALEPDLEPRGLAGAGLYADAVMDDARLAVAVARDAAAHGAALHPRTTLTALKPAAEPGWLEAEARREAGEPLHLRARRIVNATGAWADRTRTELLRMLTPGAPDPPRLLRPSRGTHLLYPALTRGHALLLLAGDGRPFFVIPFAGRSLVGTTEVEVDSPPGEAETAPTLEEVRYLHAALARALPPAADARPLAVYAGVRPLLAAPGSVGGAPREHRVVEDGPLLTVVGGKYTTFRAMARDALAHAAARLGGDPRALAESAAPLPTPLPDAADDVALGARAAGEEFALHLDDALRRRSTRWLADDRGLGAAPEVAGAMARRLGWSAARQREELDHYEASVRAEQALLARALGG